jgi:glutathione S-transferase
MLTLYYSPGACSLAPHLILEEAGAEFEAVRVTLAEGANRKPEYLAINPHGRVPALAEDGWVLTENPAILAYLGRRFPESGVLPGDLRLAARCEQLLAWSSSTVHVTFAQLWRAGRFVGDPALHEAVQARGREVLPDMFAEIEALCGKGDWLVGDRFTVADTYPFVFRRWARRAGFEVDAWPAWGAHAARVLARPAAQRALAREGLGAEEF